MVVRRFRGAEPPWPVTATPPAPVITREAQLVHRLPYTRRGKVWAPFLAQVIINPPFSIGVMVQKRPVGLRQWQKRGHIWSPYLQQFNPPITPQIVSQALKVNRLPYARRGHIWSPHLDQAFAPNPVWPVSRNQQLLRAGQRQWQRRGKNWWPATTTVLVNPPIVLGPRQPTAFVALRQWQRRGRTWMVWPQANPLTNGYWLPSFNHQALEYIALRQWQKRGHIWVPPIFQAQPPNPPYPVFKGQQTQRIGWRIWQRRGHESTSAWYLNVQQQGPPIVFQRPGQFWFRVRFWKKPGDPIWQSPVPPQLAPVNINKYSQRRSGLWVPTPRGRFHEAATQQAYALNPPITEFQARRNYRRWYEYQRQHRFWSPHFDQSYPPNPPFPPDWWRKRTVPKWWFGPRRGHVWNLPWPQAILGFVPSIGVYLVSDGLTTFYFLSEELITQYLASEDQL